MQATLSSVGVAVFIFMLPRWTKRSEELLNRAKVRGQNLEDLKDKTDLDDLRLEIETVGAMRLFAFALLVLLAAVPILLAELYFLQLMPNEIFIHLLSLIFLVAIFSVIYSVYRGGRG